MRMTHPDRAVRPRRAVASARRVRNRPERAVKLSERRRYPVPHYCRMACLHDADILAYVLVARMNGVDAHETRLANNPAACMAGSSTAGATRGDGEG